MKGTAFFCGLALAAASLAAAEERAELKAAGVGRALFVQYCASCHGIDAKGGGPTAEALKTQLPDLTSLSMKDGGFDEAGVRTSIDGTRAKAAHGSRDMPVWGKVFESRPQKRGEAWAQTDIWALTEYIKSIQAQK